MNYIGKTCYLYRYLDKYCPSAREKKRIFGSNRSFYGPPVPIGDLVCLYEYQKTDGTIFICHNPPPVFPSCKLLKIKLYKYDGIPTLKYYSWVKPL